MSQAHSTASGDQASAAANIYCPSPTCRKRMLIPAEWEKKPVRSKCRACNEPFFLDWCPLCQSWNTIAVRSGERRKCATTVCQNFLEVVNLRCPTCERETAFLTSTETPERFLCSECNHIAESEKPKTSSLDLDLDNILPAAEAAAEQKANSIYSSDASAAKPGGITRTQATPQGVPPRPVASGGTAPQRPGPTAPPRPPVGPAARQGSIEEKLDALIGSLNEIKQLLPLDPVSRDGFDAKLALWERVFPGSELKPNQKWINSNSELATALRDVEKFMLGPKDQEKKTTKGQLIKAHRWPDLPTAIKKILAEALKELSADEDNAPQKGQEAKSRASGNASSRQATKGTFGTESTEQGADLTPAFDMVRKIQKLNLGVLQCLPELFDSIEGCLADEAGQHGDGGPIRGASLIVNAVKQRIEGHLENWLAVNKFIKEVPGESDLYDETRHDRDHDIRSQDRELDGKIHSVLQPGYVFGDGESRFVLRKPRVVVWYVD